MHEKSFLEILSEKIEKQLRQDLSFSEISVENPISTTQAAPHMRTWVYQIPVEKVHIQTPRDYILKRAYPSSHHAFQKAHVPPTPSRKPHQLTEQQKQSMVYFWSWQVRLREDFTQGELKKAFRALAQRLHPDRNNGQVQAFLDLKNHYQRLLNVF